MSPIKKLAVMCEEDLLCYIRIGNKTFRNLRNTMTVKLLIRLPKQLQKSQFKEGVTVVFVQHKLSMN